MKRGKRILTLLLSASIFISSGFFTSCANDTHVHAWQLAAKTDPTCTQSGEKFYVCDCELSRSLTVPALGHDTDVIIAQAATCENVGWEEYELCKRCDYTSYKELPKLQHEWTAGTDGMIFCKHCGEIKTYGEHTHVWDEGNITVEAECEKAGEIEYVCTSCGELKKETIEALEHVGGVATCILQATCTRCGELYGELASHEYQDGICKFCGEEDMNNSSDDSSSEIEDSGSEIEDNSSEIEDSSSEIEDSSSEIEDSSSDNEDSSGSGEPEDSEDSNPSDKSGLSFTLNSTGNGYICNGWDETNSRRLKIPDTYNGKPVTEIAKNAFSHNPRLVSVEIGQNVKKIGESAFYDCCNLVEVYNRSTLTFTPASNTHGNIASYAKAVYTASYTSKIKEDGKGFITYTDGTEVILIGYSGTSKNLTLPRAKQ